MNVRARDVEIRRPCPVRLDPARAEGGVRSWYCGHCEKSVHVLSNMTESEARTFMAERAGQDLCVTYAVRRDGSIRFAPEPAQARAPELVPARALLRRRNAAAAVGLGLALAACAPHDNPQVESGMRIADPPVHVRDARPTIPDASARIEPDEVLVDGDVGMREPPPPPPPPVPEDLVDGQVALELPPPPPAGGITAAPLPADDEIADEPCDAPARPPVKMRRGGVRLRSTSR